MNTIFNANLYIGRDIATPSRIVQLSCNFFCHSFKLSSSSSSFSRDFIVEPMQLHRRDEKEKKKKEKEKKRKKIVSRYL